MRAFNDAQTVPKVEPPAQKVDSAQKDEGQFGRNVTLGFWGALAAIYIIWDYVVLGNRQLKETLAPSNIRANLYNLVVVGIAAVIFVNIGKVALVKLAAWNIPGISWLAEELTPLCEL